jgi:hypothetical protein
MMEKQQQQQPIPPPKFKSRSGNTVNNNTNPKASNQFKLTNRGVAKTTNDDYNSSPHKSKNKFARMGQRHASRPKTLNTTATTKAPNPLSPSNDSAALSEAFQATVNEQEGEKLSAELTQRRKYNSESEHSSLKVSDSAPVPKNLQQAADEASFISGLSSVGSAGRSARHNRNQFRQYQKAPGEAKTLTPNNNTGSHEKFRQDPSISPHLRDHVESEMDATANTSFTDQKSQPKHRRVKSNMDKATEAIMDDQFVSQNEQEISEFQKAVSALSLREIASDLREFTGVDFSKAQESLEKAGVDFSKAQDTLERAKPFLSTAQDSLSRNMAAASISINKFMEGSISPRAKEATATDAVPVPEEEPTSDNVPSTEPAVVSPEKGEETPEQSQETEKMKEKTAGTEEVNIFTKSIERPEEDFFDDVWEEFPPMIPTVEGNSLYNQNKPLL